MNIRSVGCLSLLLLLAAAPLRAQVSLDLTGGELYRLHCASCHGAAGRGDGPVASALLRKPPDLTRLAARRGGNFPEMEMRRIIDGRDVPEAHRGRDMPIWGLEFSRLPPQGTSRTTSATVLIDRLVEHLRSLQVQ